MCIHVRQDIIFVTSYAVFTVVVICQVSHKIVLFNRSNTCNFSSIIIQQEAVSSMLIYLHTDVVNVKTAVVINVTAQ